MKKVLIAVGIIFVAICITAVATAQVTTTTFGFTTDPDVGISGPNGTIVLVGSVDIPKAQQGLDCDVVVDVRNNSSVRQGTDILIAADGGVLELDNVEAVAGNAPPKNIGHVVIGEIVLAGVRFGMEGVASVDADIHLVCGEEPPPTVPTTTPPTTTVPPSITTPPPTVAPPVAVVIPAKFTG